MHHCVYSYLGECKSGRTSIWKLRVFKNDKFIEKRVTIEVDNYKKEIVQIKGKYNSNPNVDDMTIIKKWAEEEGLTINIFEIDVPDIL